MAITHPKCNKTPFPRRVSASCFYCRIPFISKSISTPAFTRASDLRNPSTSTCYENSGTETYGILKKPNPAKKGRY